MISSNHTSTSPYRNHTVHSDTRPPPGPPPPFLFPKAPLPHEQGRDKRQGTREGLEGKHPHNGDLVAPADDLGRGGGQLLDVVEGLPDAGLDLPGGLAAAQPRRQLGPQDLLQEGRGDADAYGGAERAEEVGAGDDDRRVILGGVGEERDEAGRDACNYG